MNVYLKSLLVFSSKIENCFFTEFHERFNIIKGKNTSGKSTLIQTIIYAFGINDGKEKLSEILKDDLVFRLDLVFNGNEIVLIRDKGSYYIFSGNDFSVVKRFDGIDSDKSKEHINLKKYISNLFGFDLVLESKGNLVSSPLEVMLLPSYVSQSVGWVYLRESFSNLSYYKDFKVDYLDYHLGVIKGHERVEYNKLSKQKNKNNEEIDFLNEIGGGDNEIIVAKLNDEKYVSRSYSYLEEYRGLCEDLVINESKYIELCNIKSLGIERKKVLRKIKKNLTQQNPGYDLCPVCTRSLPNSLEDRYKYYQDVNNTTEELRLISGKNNKTLSEINSILNKISEITKKIEIHYGNLLKHTRDDKSYSFDQWLDTKVKVQYYDEVERRISNKMIDNERIELKLSKFSSEEDAEKLRNNKSNEFYMIFIKYMKELKVSMPKERKYTSLYNINSFPFQGVELHKTVMAYHFAFNNLILDTKGVTSFPFLLDAIMKEDVDEENRNLIFNFISNNSPKDKQVLFSVSESLEDRKYKNSKNIEFVQEKYFLGNSKVIQIGDGINERMFLSEINSKEEFFINETIRLIDSA